MLGSGMLRSTSGQVNLYAILTALAAFLRCELSDVSRYSSHPEVVGRPFPEVDITVQHLSQLSEDKASSAKLSSPRIRPSHVPL